MISFYEAGYEICSGLGRLSSLQLIHFLDLYKSLQFTLPKETYLSPSPISLEYLVSITLNTGIR